MEEREEREPCHAPGGEGGGERAARLEERERAETEVRRGASYE
jgi:hypothetical protein